LRREKKEKKKQEKKNKKDKKRSTPDESEVVSKPAKIPPAKKKKGEEDLTPKVRSPKEIVKAKTDHVDLAANGSDFETALYLSKESKSANSSYKDCRDQFGSQFLATVLLDPTILSPTPPKFQTKTVRESQVQAIETALWQETSWIQPQALAVHIEGSLSGEFRIIFSFVKLYLLFVQCHSQSNRTLDDEVLRLRTRPASLQEWCVLNNSRLLVLSGNHSVLAYRRAWGHMEVLGVRASDLVWKRDGVPVQIFYGFTTEAEVSIFNLSSYFWS
jgi:hypothetical protein